MSVDQYIRTLNQIDKEIADLEKKLAEESKNEATKTKKLMILAKASRKTLPLLHILLR